VPDIPQQIRSQVRARAAKRCEYCGVVERFGLASHEIDHIVALKHGGLSTLENLAWCCKLCNRHKGPCLTSVDIATGELCRIFHPRRDRWEEHFEMNGVEIRPLTAIGRVTAQLLKLNDPPRIRERSLK